ncbi:MAG: galactofuranosyltransferase [Tannerellaceae bacterium]|jgi:hypothetical protein|nr:galactofuranosyltransferase [Tannerellaceae bacterium]
MGRYYLSKNYKDSNGAGNKAKQDIEAIMSGLGYKNAGMKQTKYKNPVAGFVITLIGVLKVLFTVSANDTVVLQYPLKKYYSFVCNLIHLKKGRVITVIHDLGTFRRKKLTAEKEMKRLSHTDVLIVHNMFMKKWLEGQNYTKPVVCLEIFDYLSHSAKAECSPKDKDRLYSVIYAGGLSFKKNKFLYHLENHIHEWDFILYGNGFEKERISKDDHFIYKGFTPSDDLIKASDGDFGLVWDGDSINHCSGNFGEYLKLNNPHKTSLYIRCHLPVIIWEEAALAKFVSENHIGICIRSLEELDTILPAISEEEFHIMRQNTIEISRRLASGYYLKKALNEALNINA